MVDFTWNIKIHLVYATFINWRVFRRNVEGVELLLNSIKSNETRKKYSTHFRKYMELQGLDDPFWQYNPRRIEREIINFIIEMKSKKMSYSAIQIYTSKVLAFYKINHQSYLAIEQFSARLMTAISRPLKTIAQL